MSADLVTDCRSLEHNGAGVLRFTVTGDQALDELISGQLGLITKDLLGSLAPDKVVALLLGGGYGRGEGGALCSDSGFRPYNDYDLVLVHTYEHAVQLNGILQRVHQEHSNRCGVHVDITPVQFSKVHKLPHTLTWYELQQGHQVLLGDQDVLAGMGSRTLESLPESEWGRLLFNRGSGLLFSLWLHQNKPSPVAEGEPFVEFVTRQIQKAWLALGDTWLASRGAYDTKVVNRRRNWTACGDQVPDWSAYYLRAIDFKLSPVLDRSSADLTAELAILAPLYRAELQRYRSSQNKPLVGLYSTLRYVRPTLWPLSWPWRYPRERLRLALMAELGGHTLARHRLVGAIDAYVRLWQRYA